MHDFSTLTGLVCSRTGQHIAQIIVESQSGKCAADGDVRHAARRSNDAPRCHGNPTQHDVALSRGAAGTRCLGDRDAGRRNDATASGTPSGARLGVPG